MATRWADHGCIFCIVTQGLLLFALPAPAADNWRGSVGVTTDYTYRGISQTRGEPALQGGLRFQSPRGWNAGIWGSSVDFGAGSSIRHELDLHASYAWSLGHDWSAELGLVHYEYSNDEWAEYDYDELNATLSFQQRMTASVAWSPNAARYGNNMFVRDKRAVAYELALLQPLAAHWSLCAGIGHYDLRDLFGAGYWFWNAGVAFTWQALQFDFLHINTDSAARRLFEQPGGGGRWTAVLSWRF